VGKWRQRAFQRDGTGQVSQRACRTARARLCGHLLQLQRDLCRKTAMLRTHELELDEDKLEAHAPRCGNGHQLQNAKQQAQGRRVILVKTCILLQVMVMGTEGLLMG
jgi:hypothetical protein